MQVLRHGRFGGDKEMLENLVVFSLIIYLCGETFSDSWKEWFGMCGVMPLRKAKLSWASGLG